jgi:hypothetical protein
MAIRAKCQFCGHVSVVDNARAGQFIDCPNCRAELTVPDFQDDSDVTEFSGLPGRQFWVLALGAVGIVIVGFTIAFIAKRIPRKIAARNPLPVLAPRANPLQPPLPRRPPPARPAPPQPAPLVARRDPLNRPVARPRVVRWTVIADPPGPTPAVPPNHHVHIAIPEGPNPEIVFPATPGTVVSVGQAGHGRELREIWDYRTLQKIGTTQGLQTLTENLEGFFRPVSALSADGHYFVTQGMSPLKLVFWDVIAQSPLAVREPHHSATASLIFAAFSSPHQVVTGGFGVPFQSLQRGSATRKVFQDFPRWQAFDRDSLAVSPGGRYLAVFDRSRQLLRFYNTIAATTVGQLPLPPFEPGGPMDCQCVAFSPNGREVAGLFFYNSHHHLACWELNTGKLVERVEFGGNLRAILGAPQAYLFTPLEWFPQQNRWLVFGQGIVDRNTKRLIWTIPDEAHRYRFGIRHVASDDCVLSVVDEDNRLALASIQLPLAEIDRAAQSPPTPKSTPDAQGGPPPTDKHDSVQAPKSTALKESR